MTAPAPQPATRERGILFSASMVRAILAGTKTQTRRLVKPQPPNGYDLFAGKGLEAVWTRGDEEHAAACPYGAPGDRLWVRETWRPNNAAGEPVPSAYRADQDPYTDGHRWRPAIHMPRRASRIDLEVTAVRVERLQEITEEDARAEGVRCRPWVACEECASTAHGDRSQESCWCRCHGTARACFSLLWEEINGKRAPWASNPWVWVVSFRRLRP